MTVRFMTWNIKTGGFDRHGDRFAALVAVVNREAPDLLTLQELRDFGRDDGRRMRLFADAVGMEAHLARSAFGQPVAVLVRPPLRMTARSAVTWRLHHAVAVASVGPLTVVSAHLNPFNSYRRYREALWLAARHRPSHGPVLIAGDLNGLAPGVDHTETLAAQPMLFRRRHLASDGTTDTRAVGAFLDAGFVDLWPAGDPGLTVPTTRGGGREFSRMRLDYVLASPSVAGTAKDMRVVRGDETEYASDHYPLRVDLDL